MIISCTLALLVAGCSKSNSGSVPASAKNTAPVNLPKPCSLITQDELESALGKKATMRDAANPRTGIEECTLVPVHGGDMDHITIVLHDTTQQDWEALKKTYAQDKSTPIPGLGDDAINAGQLGVWARKGNIYMQIYGVINYQRDEKAELFLAEKALSRL
ncbi:MAG TPA: hypothetical protein VFA71_13310 [Terriglobales bacterium]|nr:hypothetical protein [Terriglobales bacterium]